MNCYSILKTSSLGDLLLVAKETHLTGVYFLDCPHAPPLAGLGKPAPRHPTLQRAREEIREYLAGAAKPFSTPLHFSGTEFQMQVWREIAQIPRGETVTYTELARRAWKPAAIRAAGTATGRNPLSVIIPCHRIVGRDGSLGGYAGGMRRKQELLALEKKYPAI